VLVAEDEALIRMDLVEMLEEDGYTVVGQAADGAAAVRLAGELRPDLVLLDVRMPVLDGLSAAEQIVAARIAPVVILTAFSQRDLVERAREAGVMAYLVKPFQRKDLLPAIEMAVSRFAELVALEKEVGDLAGRLEARKLVDRAKGALQTAGMTEPEAFRHIQRRSMDERRSMRAVAQDVLDAAAVTGPTPAGNDRCRSCRTEPRFGHDLTTTGSRPGQAAPARGRLG
jgi:response regulator NasT